MFDNAKPIDASEAEKKLKEDYPGLLLKDERIDLAYKTIRDQYCFTNFRILVVDVQGITGKKIEFQTMPYRAIKAFSVETAGGGLDGDCELQIFCESGMNAEGFGMVDIGMDFDKNKVNIFDIQRYLSAHVFPDNEDPHCSKYERPHATDVNLQTSSTSNILDVICNDSRRVSEKEVQENLAKQGALLPNEIVELAYKSGRDFTICTSKRMLYMDVKGISGKRINFLSLRFKCIKAYGIETAGGMFDRDSEFQIYTNIGVHQRKLKTNVRKGQSNIMEVLWYFNHKLLGNDVRASKEQFLEMAAPSCQSSIEKAFAWLGNDFGLIDAGMTNERFHSNPCVLQMDETVEMAFKGIRDFVLITNKRILFVDIKGFSGKKMEFTSVPYSSIKMCQLTTAGKMDKDCEFGIYTEIWYDPQPPTEENKNPPPLPGMSYIEFDIQKNVDVLALFRIVSEKVNFVNGLKDQLSLAPPQYFPSQPFQPSPQGAMSKLMDVLGSNFATDDPQKVQQQLGFGGGSPVLDFNEEVLMAFKCGRDSIVFTNKSILDIDKQGFSGKRTRFLRIPYNSIRSFGAETAGGSFDKDSELDLHFRTPWCQVIKRDFKKGKVDICALQYLLCAKTLGPPGRLGDKYDENKVVDGKHGSFDKFMSFLKEKNLEIDPKQAEEKFRNEVPMLQDDETVEMAFKHGRDMFLITSKRVVNIDVKGMTGKRVEFESYPFAHMACFSVSSGGTISRTVKLRCMNTSLKGQLEIGFKKDVNIFDINNSLSNKVLRF